MPIRSRLGFGIKCCYSKFLLLGLPLSNISIDLVQTSWIWYFPLERTTHRPSLAIYSASLKPTKNPQASFPFDNAAESSRQVESVPCGLFPLPCVTTLISASISSSANSFCLLVFCCFFLVFLPSNPHQVRHQQLARQTWGGVVAAALVTLRGQKSLCSVPTAAPNLCLWTGVIRAGLIFITTLPWLLSSLTVITTVHWARVEQTFGRLQMGTGQLGPSDGSFELKS